MTSDSRMDRKCYGQICPVSTALDVAGDRWTFLILRELLGGPARFQEILDGLPGVARNLLTSRLRRLEADGVVRRVDSQGASLYALTELGGAVRPALEELGFWGTRLQRVGPPTYGRSVRAFAMAVQAILVRAGGSLPDERHVVELEVDGEHLEIVLGPDPTVVARISTEATTRISVAADVLSDLVLGVATDDDEFRVMSGAPEARSVLLEAMRAPFAGGRS